MYPLVDGKERIIVVTAYGYKHSYILCSNTYVTIFIHFRYYKTVAAQEPGEDNILSASYGKIFKDVSMSTHLLPQFGTDYGLCR